MRERKKGGGKRAQVTIFIIIAILVIAIGVLIYMYYPRLRPTISVESQNPPAYIQECMEEKISETADILSLQGGSVAPEFYYNYEKNKIEYLCYTNQYYQSCVVQQPMLIQHIQSEILNEIEDETVSCFNSMKESYENKGYDVNMKPGDTVVELLPGKIITTFNYEFVITKGDTERYENFKIVLDNNLYELAAITNSIINWETQYGDAEITTYMNYYHYLKVEKIKQIDESTIYILTNRDTEKKFQFASRSYAFPPGHSIPPGDII